MNKYISLLHTSICFMLILVSSMGIAQSVEEDKVKAVFIYNFMKHTTWPNETSKLNFTISVYQNRELYQTLNSLLTDKKLREKPLNILLSSNLNELKKADVAIIPTNLNTEVEEIAFSLRRTQTLLITQNSDIKKDVMINFIHDQEKHKISFEINKSNIIYEELNISSELLLLGGSELDVATLYRETELAMQKAKVQQNQMEENISALQQQLSAASSDLTRSRQQLNKNNLALSQKEQALKNLESRLIKLQESFLSKEQEIAKISEQNELALQKTQQIQQTLAQKNKDVEIRENEISQLEEKIQQNNSEIEKQISQLKLQEAEITNKNQTIKSKNTYLTITLVFIFIVTIFAFLLIFLFLRNRKVTAELQQTLQNLENTQTQLVQSEKMASLGVLTAGISHEVNTPIGIVVTSLSIIQQRLDDLFSKVTENKLTKSKLNQALVDIRESTSVSEKSLTRVTVLLSNFKQVAVDHVIEEPREINLGKYIEEILETLSSQLKKQNIRYNLSSNESISITTIPGALAQVFTNLITNTISHAFEQAPQDRNNALIDIQLHKNVDDKLTIEFSDNGCGMSKEVLSNIYEPFYTTKRHSGGTGLGMNIVYNIVLQKLKGKIDIQSSENQGTKVTLQLPRFIESDTSIAKNLPEN